MSPTVVGLIIVLCSGTSDVSRNVAAHVARECGYTQIHVNLGVVARMPLGPARVVLRVSSESPFFTTHMPYLSHAAQIGVAELEEWRIRAGIP